MGSSREDNLADAGADRMRSWEAKMSQRPRLGHGGLLSLLLLLVAVPALGQEKGNEAGLLVGPSNGPWRRLLLDATVVESQQGTERLFHAAQKYPKNPLLTADRPWESNAQGGGPALLGTVLADDGVLRMWYQCFTGGYFNGYAESKDGLQWTKPNLGLLPFDGSKDNNLFLSVTQDPAEKPPLKDLGQCHNPTIIKRPWEPDPAKRYALFCYAPDYRHARQAFSPDGLHWTFVPEAGEKDPFSLAEELNFFYDPYQKRYVATWKTLDRRGRAVGIAFSEDGLKWTKPLEAPVFVADDLDPDATQIFGMPVFAYQGLYIGLPWIYNARWLKYGTYSDQRVADAEKDSPCTVDVQLAWSWDLINWTRPDRRRPLIPRGQAGEFDAGQIFTAAAPVQVEDTLYFYYGGFSEPHNSPSQKSSIGLATLRLDGFCSIHAGDDEGWLVTRREVFGVPKITINAKTGQGGYVVAEILDRDNNPIPGFTRSDCVPFTGDATRHILTWRTEALPASHAVQEKKLRYYLKNAELYSYLPQ